MEREVEEGGERYNRGKVSVRVMVEREVEGGGERGGGRWREI